MVADHGAQAPQDGQTPVADIEELVVFQRG